MTNPNIMSSFHGSCSFKKKRRRKKKGEDEQVVISKYSTRTLKVVLNALVMRQRLSKSNSINQSIWTVHMTPPSALYAPARLCYVAFTAPEVMRYIMLVLKCIAAPRQAGKKKKKP